MSTRRATRLAAAVAALGLTFAACGGGSDSSEPVATDAPAAADDAPAAEAGADEAPAGGAVPEILQFNAPLIGGGEIDAASLSGKPTAFWFWSPT